MSDIINITDLVKFFDTVREPVRATIVTRTPVRMNKRDVATKTISNPYVAFKVQTIEVELNANYEIKVNTARFLENKEQTFEAEGRVWGENVNGSIVKHGDQLYLKVIEGDRVGAPVYELENGDAVEYSALKPFIPAYKPSAKQGVDEEVKSRSYKLENVIGMFIPSMKVRFVGR